MDDGDVENGEKITRRQMEEKLRKPKISREEI